MQNTAGSFQVPWLALVYFAPMQINLFKFYQFKFKRSIFFNSFSWFGQSGNLFYMTRCLKTFVRLYGQKLSKNRVWSCGIPFGHDFRNHFFCKPIFSNLSFCILVFKTFISIFHAEKLTCCLWLKFGFCLDWWSIDRTPWEEPPRCYNKENLWRVMVIVRRRVDGIKSQAKGTKLYFPLFSYYLNALPKL